MIRVIAETQKIPADTIGREASFEELKFDSLDGINILFALENEFDINIPDESARHIKSIPQMVDGIAAMLQSKATLTASEIRSQSPEGVALLPHKAPEGR
ncbi:phosphopantetheine-binding protein [Bryobacter aggregatus]|uniref:phosphopantetheine-binding protein n=1 Tax=Bryobacter aggregatus TaxID=360054 RepID=UPI000691BB3D|nr:phosphopantetheine-binding protein [Bryobacter aggregatus]